MIRQLKVGVTGNPRPMADANAKTSGTFPGNEGKFYQAGVIRPSICSLAHSHTHPLAHSFIHSFIRST